MKRKTLAAILLAAVMAFTLCAFSACKPKDSVKISEESVSLTIFETKTLTATATSGEEIVWASSDPGIVTVNDGTLIPQKKGTAVVTASAGGVRGECTVTVTVPDDTEIHVCADAQIRLAVNAEVKPIYYAETGTRELDGGTFSFTSSAENVASVSSDGMISGKEKGEATITVGGEWKGVQMRPAIIRVEVDDSVVIAVNSDSIRLKRSDDDITQGLENSFPLTISVTENGTDIQNPPVTVTVAPDGIVSVGKDFTVTALKSGVAEITLSYTSSQGTLATKKVSAEVVYPVTEIDMGETLSQGLNRNYTYTLEGVDGEIREIVSATLGEDRVEATAKGGTLNVEFIGSKASEGDKTLRIVLRTDTDEYILHRTLHTVDFMIGSVEEFNEFVTALADTTKYYYAELDGNIDFAGEELIRKMTDKTRSSASFYLDGKGFFVKGIKLTSTDGGIFGDVGFDSASYTQLKNIAFIDITNYGQGGVFVNLKNADLKDVYIEIEAHYFLGGGVSYSTENVKLTNVVALTKFVNKSGGEIRKNAAGDFISEAEQILGAIAVSTKGTEDSNVYAVSNSNYIFGESEKNPNTLFADFAAMRAEVTELPVGFNTDYWTTDHGVLIFKSVQNTILPGITLEISTLPASLTIGDNLFLSVTDGKTVTWAVNGLDASEYTLTDNTLSLSENAAVDKTFTVTATYIDARYGIAVTAESTAIRVEKKKSQVTETLENATVVKNRDGKFEFAIDEGFEVNSLTEGETSFDVPAVAENKLVLGKEFFEQIAGGMHTFQLKIENEDVIKTYTVTVSVVDFMIGDATEFNAFADALKQAGSSLVAELTADFDGSAITPVGNGIKRAFTLDGKGHYISGASTTNGLFGNLDGLTLNITVRNIALISLQPGDPCGLIVNAGGNTVELYDVYVSYAVKVNNNFAAPVVFAPGSNTRLENVVSVVEVGSNTTTGEIGAIARTGEIDASKWNNVYAVSNAKSLHPAYTDKSTLFADFAAMRAEVTELPVGFNTDYWTTDHGVLIFKSVQNTILPGITLEISTLPASLTIGDNLLLSVTDEKTVTWAVNGLDASEYTLTDNTLSLSENAAVDKTFTVTATYIDARYGIAVTAESTAIRVEKKKSQVTETLENATVVKNRDGKFEFAIDEGFEVNSLTEGETSFDVPAVAENKLVLGKEFFEQIAGGMHTFQLKIENEDVIKTYTVTVSVVDFMIGDATEFNAFADALKQAGSPLVAELTADFDGSAITPVGSGVKRAFTLDGKGHYISGASTKNGLFGNLPSGLSGSIVVRNAAFISLQPGDPCGLIVNAGTNTVELYDVFVSYATALTGNFAAPVVFAPGPSTRLENVVAVAQVDTTKNIGAIAKEGNIDASKWNNVYAVSNAETLHPAYTDKSTLFADFAAMKAAVSSLPEGFNTDYWMVVESGLIVFKSMNDVTKAVAMTDNGVIENETHTEIFISFGLVDFKSAATAMAEPCAINQHREFNGITLMEKIFIDDGKTKRCAFDICSDNVNGKTEYKPASGWMSMGGIWAPVLVQVPADGSGIRISVYTEYLAHGTFKITLSKDFVWNTASGLCLTLTEDITYGWNESGDFIKM